MDILTFAWIALVAISGLILEAYGVMTGKGTITGSVRKAAKAYPPSIGIVSLILGALWAHFYWL